MTLGVDGFRKCTARQALGGAWSAQRPGTWLRMSALDAGLRYSTASLLTWPLVHVLLMALPALSSTVFSSLSFFLRRVARFTCVLCVICAPCLDLASCHGIASPLIGSNGTRSGTTVRANRQGRGSALPMGHGSQGLYEVDSRRFGDRIGLITVFRTAWHGHDQMTRRDQ